MLRRVASVLGLTACLAGLPVVLRAAAGPPSLAGLPSWQWLRDGPRDQYLPATPITHALGLLAWSLWGYAVIVAVLRVLAVVAARRRVAGAAALLALSNLVTLAPVRGLLDASIGMSLLAASTRATPTPTTAAAPVAVVRTIQPQVADDGGGWDRARPLLHDTRLGTLGGQPTLAQPDPPPLGRAASPEPTRTDLAAPARPPAGTPTRTYTVEDGDSLWRIAERELGDGLRWKEIWALNHGRDMGGGRIFRHAGLILPGWVLHLPAHEQPAPATPPAHPRDSERRDATATTTAPPASAPAPSITIQAPSPPAGRAAGERGQSGSAATRPAPGAQPDGASRHGKGHKILELPTGEVVGITLAAAITAALALARLRQRRRRLPTWPPDKDSAAPLEAGPTTQRLVRFAHQYTKPPDDEAAEGAAEPPALPPHGPPDPRDPAPAQVVVAERAGEELAVDLAGFGAITITGPRAADAARAAMVALLAAGTPTDTQALLAGERLLSQAPELPGLRRAATLGEALGLLEAELVGRARMLELYEQPDFASYRGACPDDPLPALLLVTDEPPEREADRLLAVAEQGRRLGVGVLLAGTEVERAARIELDEEGRVQVARPAQLGAGQLVGARMLTLDAAQATDLLSTLAAARTDQQQAPAGQQPSIQHAPDDAAPHGQAQPARHHPPNQGPPRQSMKSPPRGSVSNLPASGMCRLRNRLRPLPRMVPGRWCGRWSPCGCWAPTRSRRATALSARGCGSARGNSWPTCWSIQAVSRSSRRSRRCGPTPRWARSASSSGTRWATCAACSARPAAIPARPSSTSTAATGPSRACSPSTCGASSRPSTRPVTPAMMLPPPPRCGRRPTPTAAACWTASPMGGPSRPARRCATRRWTRWRGWPSCASGLATTTAPWPRWSGRSRPTRWPRNATGA